VGTRVPHQTAQDGDAGPPPPPPPRSARVGQDGEGKLRKRPRFSNRTWDVAGYGWIVYDESRHSLDAHCGRCDHDDRRNPCRVNRISVSGKSEAQGRPLGLLIAWLFADRATRSAHHGMVVPKRQTVQDLADLCYAQRCKGRQWARDNGLAELEDLEDHEPGKPREEPQDIA
jgi:hypothetical protein